MQTNLSKLDELYMEVFPEEYHWGRCVMLETSVDNTQRFYPLECTTSVTDDKLNENSIPLRGCWKTWYEIKKQNIVIEKCLFYVLICKNNDETFLQTFNGHNYELEGVFGWNAKIKSRPQVGIDSFCKSLQISG